MKRVAFCTPCTVHQKNKCAKQLCLGLEFGDFEDFAKEHSELQTTNRCDLVLCQKAQVNFIELKAADRFTKDDGSLFSLTECMDTGNKTKQEKAIRKKFNAENARKKLECSKNAYFLAYPEQKMCSVRYFFIFSDIFVDYFNDKKNVEVNTVLIQSFLRQTIFATYPHNPVLHNNKPIPLKVGPCSKVEEYFQLQTK